jgi:protein TonB
MTATTINTFPSLHSWSSPRGWALAIIVLLHLGFFWALTNGLSIRMPSILRTTTELVSIDPQPVKPPPVAPIEDFRPPNTQQLVTVVPPVIDIPTTEEQPETIYVPPSTQPGTFRETGGVSPPVPVMIEPKIDTRRGLSEPPYPASEIRQGHEGTVVLSLHILADGRVGEVKLERSSGYQKLDDSAMREAKRWRFIPGTSDGSPLAMWKQVPITFRLNNQ